MAQPAHTAVGTAGDQFYVTHCTTADSVLNNPGYTVRAASAADPETLGEAFRYPPYELPIDLWRDLPQPHAAPRRLARTEHPDGGVWVVHSSYLAKDTVDRDRSYFSHQFLLKSADPERVLSSWGADKWVKSYPQGATKSLPRNAPLPVGDLVTEDNLTAFLGDRPPGPADLASSVCPPRLRTSAENRRDLFARVLQAMLVFDAEATQQRSRLYIHAEPGVIALLLYGAVKLLPARVTDNLTFSTFEPYHRNIRDYKLADVVGTYLGAPDKGLDADLGTVRGFALDTFVPARSSPELRGPVREMLSAGVSELIDLAARGEWALVPAVRRAMGPDADGLAQVGRAVVRARGLSRVDTGRATIDELLAIQDDAAGAGELAERADQVWPVVKEAALDPRRADVRRAFRAFLSDQARVEEVWEEAVEAILNEDFRTWDARWALLREVPGTEGAKRLLRKMLGSEKNEAKLSKVPTDVRAKMRAACKDVELLPSRPLLVPIGIGELEPLLASPPDWAGYTAFVLLANDDLGWLNHVPVPDRPRMRDRARQYLFAAPGPAIASYVHAARPYLDTDPLFLKTLFDPYSPPAAALMDKLLTTTTLEPSDWMKLCAHVGLTQDEWGEFLLEKDRLTNLLVGLGGEGVGKEVWGAYLGLLTHALVSPDLITADDIEPAVVHAWERKVHNHLKTAAERLTAGGHRLALALPEGGVARLFAANNLLKWVNSPATAERDGHEEIKHACETFGVDRLALVRVAYKKGAYAQLDLPAQLERLNPIIALFRTCYPVDSQYHTARSAVTCWLKLSVDCPKPSRAVFQAQFVVSVVPDTHYANLLAEQRQYPFEPAAEAHIRRQMAQPVKRGPPKYSPPARPAMPEPNFVNEDEPVAEEISEGDGELPTPEPIVEPKPAKRKSASRGAKSSRGTARRKKGANANKMWLIVGSIALGLLLLIVVLVLAAGPPKEKKDDPKDKKADATPTPEKKAEPKKEPESKKDSSRPDPSKKEPRDLPVAEPPVAEPPKGDAPVGPPAAPEPRPVTKVPDPAVATVPTAPEPRPVVKPDPKPPDPKPDPKGDKEVLKKIEGAMPKLSDKLPRLRLWH